MLENIKHIKRFILAFALALFSFSANAQEVRVIDNKGTIQKVSKNTPGDIKYGVQTSDHHGWYLLDGRALTTLPTNAQVAAISLFPIGTTNIPNATDRVLKHPDNSQSVGDVGGQTTTTLTQANLPNYNLPTATTSTDGNHIHSGSGNSTQTLRFIPDLLPSTSYNFVLSTGSPSSSGNHNHTVTVNSGGGNQPIQRYQPYLVVNTFIYLGL